MCLVLMMPTYEVSVHLAKFPEYKEEMIDKELEVRMQMAQDVTSMVSVSYTHLLVLRHTTAPETFAVQADIPVGEVVVRCV